MTWFLAGVALLAAEVPVPGLYLMWLGLAALGTGALTLALALPLAAEVAVFVTLAALSVALGWRLRRASPTRLPVNLPASGLVGRAAVALAFEGPEGRVRVGDTDWPARLDRGDTPAPGTMLRVVRVEGVTLVVGAS